MKVRTWMGVVVALGALMLVGCGVPPPTPTPTPGDPTGSSNTGPFAGIDETEGQMTALTSPCAFVADGGQMTINLAAGEFTVVGGTDAGTLTVNGAACGTATAANTSKITINGSADGGNETVIIDYLNGPFALGTATSAGIVIDLKGGTGDVVKIRGSNGIDTIGLGTVTAGAGSAGSFAMGVGIGAAPDSNKDITLTNVESVVISTGPGADVVTGAGSVYGAGTSAFGTATSGTAVPITIYGGDGNDTLTGGAGADTISGDANDDTINGSAGNDTELGGAGNDTFNEGATTNGADVITGGLGTDILNYGSRTANLTITLAAGANDGEAGEGDTVDNTMDTVIGGAGNDSITCDPTVICTVQGGAGNDTIVGSNLADSLDGQAGDDVIQPGTGNDTVVGGAGTDTVSYADRAAAITVALGVGGAASANNGDPLLTENDSIASVENITGGSGIDTLTGNDLDNVITGGAGNDILTGGAGNDTFVAGAAADGNDTIAGGTGEDTVDYSARAAALTIVMDGTTASGDLAATEADIIGTDVEDCIGGSAGDTITGNAAANKIDGRAGNDTLNGLAGNDEITGGLGNDIIDSGADDDIIDPGAGTNTITCGAGFDTVTPGGTTTWGVTPTDCELF